MGMTMLPFGMLSGIDVVTLPQLRRRAWNRLVPAADGDVAMDGVEVGDAGVAAVRLTRLRDAERTAQVPPGPALGLACTMYAHPAS